MLDRVFQIFKEKNMSSLVSNMTIAAMGLLGFMMLTRQMTQEDFGHWVLYLALSTFFDLLRFGLTQNSLVRMLTVADEDNQKKLLGTAFKIQVSLQIAISGFCWITYALLHFVDLQISEGYTLFLAYYPLLSLASLGWNNAMALFQAKQDFITLLWVRLLAVGGFNLILLFNLLTQQFSLTQILLFHIGFNLISSLWCSMNNWDGLRYLKQSTSTYRKEMISFGKYAMGTLVGSSLLKSADTFIIGLSPLMGSTAIALYAIPLKLTDLLGIPLRSFTMTAYPKMSRQYLNGEYELLKKTFYTYAGSITIGFIPVVIICIVMSQWLILLLAGNNYIEDVEQLNLIFQIFCVYLLLLPIDRFTGVLLDSINRPKLNLFKVIFMAVANILVDLVAVFYYQSLLVVALGTVGFTLLGIVLGFYFLKKEMSIQTQRILPESLSFIKSYLL